jgi:hypothetical protein
MGRYRLVSFQEFLFRFLVLLALIGVLLLAVLVSRN